MPGGDGLSRLLCSRARSLLGGTAFAGRMISKDPENQPFEQKLLCGMFSGLCVAKVLTPVELIKCKMQTNNEAAVVYKNSVECIAAIIRCARGALACAVRGRVQPCWRAPHARTTQTRSHGN